MHNTRQGLTPLLRVEWNSKIPVTTGEEPRISCLNSRWDPIPLQWCKRNPEVLWLLERRPNFPEATREVPWGPCHNSRGTSSFQSQLENNHEIPPWTRDEAWFPCSALRSISILSPNLKGGLTPFMQCQWFPMIPVATREEPHVPHLILRWGLIPLHRLERNPDCPLPPQEETFLTYCNSKGTPSFLLQIKRTLSSPSTRDKAWFPCSDSNGTPSFPSQHEGRSDSPVSPLEKVRVSHFNSTWGLPPLLKLKRKVEFHASTWSKAYFPVETQ